MRVEQQQKSTVSKHAGVGQRHTEHFSQSTPSFITVRVKIVPPTTSASSLPHSDGLGHPSCLIVEVGSQENAVHSEAVPRTGISDLWNSLI
ncbi:hypothetical protein J6590_081963 [Homalodisca vitripennis]|nr:hypothetical protein J6590_081963 [Homalodisca vitripennis]